MKPAIAATFRAHIESLPDRPNASLLRIQGRIRYEEAPKLRELLLDEVARTNASMFIVDLGAVDNIDTAGVAVLVESLLASRQRGLRMFLCAPSESVVQTFRLAGLDEALEACCGADEIAQKIMAQDTPDVAS